MVELYFLWSKKVKQRLRSLWPQLMASGVFAMMATVFIISPQEAYAAEQGNKAACDGSSSRPEVAYNRQGWCGYFNNEGWTAGPGLRGGSWSVKSGDGGSWEDATEKSPAVPKNIDTAKEFVEMVVDDLENGDKRAVTSAQFMILSTLGVEADTGETVKKAVTTAHVEEWKKRVMSYADEGEDEGFSIGKNGSIEWFEDVHLQCGSVNTYYQIDQNDIAPFQVNERNTPECKDTKSTEEFITFRDAQGRVVLQIKRICMNAAGHIGILSASDEELVKEPEQERPERAREFTPQEVEHTEKVELVEEIEQNGQGGEREAPRATLAEAVIPDEEIVEKEQIAQAKAELAFTGAPAIFMTIGAIIVIVSGLLLATRRLWSR